jgi:hypothetical protein
MAVWALRVGYVGLAVAIAGLVALAFGSTSWILAGGVIMWLATVPVTLTGFLWARHELPEPRPGSGRCGSCSSTTPSIPCSRGGCCASDTHECRALSGYCRTHVYAA